MCLNQKKQIVNSTIIGSERNGMGQSFILPFFKTLDLTNLKTSDPKAELIKEAENYGSVSQDDDNHTN